MVTCVPSSVRYCYCIGSLYNVCIACCVFTPDIHFHVVFSVCDQCLFAASATCLAANSLRLHVFIHSLFASASAGIVDNMRHLLPLVSQADREHYSTTKRVRHLNELAKVNHPFPSGRSSHLNELAKVERPFHQAGVRRALT